MHKKLTCIVCPIGCEVTVDYSGKKIRKISGAKCLRGEDYVQDEIISPTRTLTTTLRVIGGDEPLVSARSNKPIPKNKIKSAVKKLSKIKVKAPIEVGDVLMKNILGLKADVIATKSVSQN